MEDGNLDTNKADRAVWLMKSPLIVSDCLQPSSSSIPNGARVAKVIVSIDPLRPDADDSTEFTMELSGNILGNVPKRYSMEMSKDFVPMSVFSESQGKVSVEGKIKNKFDMRPHNDTIADYGRFCRQRTAKSMTKTRQIQMIGSDTPMIPMPGIIHTQEKKKAVVKGSDTKRTRRDRGEMEDILFKLFEHQPNWTLKELVQKTDQPEQFMKNILKDLCVYNNKGANQGSYELKPEYTRTLNDPSAS
ncbi:transcription initiation factor IIF subunit beta-like [Amaranthus tricolor]|uniref:transcription initiation factor IIF subunit beta-like n=1 Tax=Amaranthus tricolor TaxID=29722 RepID=UPI00258E7060|nr:transcription initiation factor IIF subunit beta-like [Amaranthus tricolor]